MGLEPSTDPSAMHGFNVTLPTTSTKRITACIWKTSRDFATRTSLNTPVFGTPHLSNNHPPWARHSPKSQFYPPHPTLTESNLPSQRGKVFIVTGGYSGVGLHLTQILYAQHGTIYIAGRSQSQALIAITSIKALFPDSEGSLVFLPLDLADLSTIKASADEFLSKEKKLDVLWNNAGVSLPPAGSASAQGHELQIATNCLGPHLFTQLLLPALIAAAERAPAGTVRVVWTSSLVVDLSAPKGGIHIPDLTNPSTSKSKIPRLPLLPLQNRKLLPRL